MKNSRMKIFVCLSILLTILMISSQLVIAAPPQRATIYEEDFTGVSAYTLPEGWSTDYSGNWFVSDTNNITGATAPELMLLYFDSPGENVTMRVQTGQISITGYRSLQFSFKHYVDHWDSASPRTYELFVETSTDNGVTFKPTKWLIYPSDYSDGVNDTYVGPETVTIKLNGLKADSIKFTWVLNGVGYDIDCWYIDDVLLTGIQ